MSYAVAIEHPNEVASRKLDSLADLVFNVEQLSAEEIAERLGLELDRAAYRSNVRQLPMAQVQRHSRGDPDMAQHRTLFDDPNLTFSKLCAVWLLTLDPRMQIKGFSKTLCAAVRLKSRGEASDLRDLIDENRIIPDAYVVDRHESTVYLFEIEDTNPISAVKLRKLSEIWFCLDSIDWEMRVFLIDRYMTCWRSLPLEDVWYALKWPDPSKSDFDRNVQQRDAEFDWEATHRAASRRAINLPIVKRKRSSPVV